MGHHQPLSLAVPLPWPAALRLTVGRWLCVPAFQRVCPVSGAGASCLPATV